MAKNKARKKTSNEWFETQDSISYWDVFGRNLANGGYDSYIHGMY